MVNFGQRMRMKRITIKIAADGKSTSVQTEGFSGPSCQKATAGLERRLGEVQDNQQTDEYVEQQTEQEIVQGQG